MPDALKPALAAELCAGLDAALAGGLRDDPLEHAGQVAAVAAGLWRAFQGVGVKCVLVGGSAIEVHAPGLYVTGDVDVVLDAFGRAGVRETADTVLTALGLTRAEAAYDALRAIATAADRLVDVDALERMLDELRRPRDGRTSCARAISRR